MSFWSSFVFDLAQSLRKMQILKHGDIFLINVWLRVVMIFYIYILESNHYQVNSENILRRRNGWGKQRERAIMATGREESRLLK